MKALAREFGYAFCSWLVPLVVSISISSLKTSHRPLFESLMAVTLAGSTVLIGSIYLRRRPGNPTRLGVRIGLLWMIANWMLDGLMFSGGPMKMSFSEYAMDIGTAYFMIPLITIGLGFMRRTSQTERVTEEAMD